MRFKPQDSSVRLIYGQYLAKKGDYKGAMQRYLEAYAMNPKSPETAYAIGLLYFKTEDYAKSLSYAKKAYGSGYPLPGLRKKLEAKGLWNQDSKME